VFPKQLEGAFVRIRAGRAGLTAVALVAGCGGGADARSGGAEEDKADRESAASGSTDSGSASLAPSSASSSGSRLGSAELQGRWWTWASMEPEGTNPVADPDGSQCARNQPTDVWFLAGTFGTHVARACTVPGTTPLAFPLVNLYGEADDCADFMSAAEGSAVLDGRKILPDTYRGEPIQVRGVAGNAVTGRSGTYAVTGCGLWAQVPPLKPGRHTLSLRGRSGDNFSVGVDYTLVVKAGSE
jgi:hypothetical protein